MKAIEQFLSLVHADPSRKQELLHYLQTDDQANIIRMASLLGVTLSPEELANRIETPVETASSFSPPP